MLRFALQETLVTLVVQQIIPAQGVVVGLFGYGTLVLRQVAVVVAVALAIQGTPVPPVIQEMLEVLEILALPQPHLQ
jgi:hypothetical protein